MLSVIIVTIAYIICLLVMPEKVTFIQSEDVPGWILFVSQVVLVIIATRVLFFLSGIFFKKKVFTREEELLPREDGKYLEIYSNGGDLYYKLKTKNGDFSLKDDIGTDVITIYGDETPFFKIEDRGFENQYVSLFFYKMKEVKFYVHIPTSEFGDPVKTIYDDRPSMDGIHGM